MSKIRTLLCALGLLLCLSSTADAQVYGIGYAPGYRVGVPYGGGFGIGGPAYGSYYGYNYSYSAPRPPAYQVVPVVGVQKTTIRTIRVIRVRKAPVNPCGCQ